MRPADDRHAAPRYREGSQIERAVELMALHANQRHEFVRAPAGRHIGEISGVGMNVFVNRPDIGKLAPEDPLGQVPHIGQRAIRHESLAEPLNVTVRTVLARFDQNNFQRLRQSQFLPQPVPLMGGCWWARHGLTELRQATWPGLSALLLPRLARCGRQVQVCLFTSAD